MKSLFRTKTNIINRNIIANTILSLNSIIIKLKKKINGKEIQKNENNSYQKKI